MGKKHHTAVIQCKSSAISSHNKHHGSTGDYFSFGNKIRYNTVDFSSVWQYSTKPHLKIEQKGKCVIIEELIARELKEGIESLGKCIPLLKEYIAPVF